MALRPAPDLDPRLSARHPLAPRKQRSAAGREPRPRADPPTATYTSHTTASEAPAVLGALLLWTACGAIRASPHAGMLSWSAARAPQRAHRQAHLVFRSWFPVRTDDFPCNTHTIIATTFVKVSTIQGNCWFPSKWSTFCERWSRQRPTRAPYLRLRRKRGREQALTRAPKNLVVADLAACR